MSYVTVSSVLRVVRFIAHPERSLRPTNKPWLSVAYRGGGGWGVQTPPPEIPKALQNRAKLNPIVKTVKNC